MCRELLLTPNRLPYDTWAWKVCRYGGEDTYLSQWKIHARCPLPETFFQKIMKRRRPYSALGTVLEYRLGKETKSPIPETFGIITFKSIEGAMEWAVYGAQYTAILCKLPAGQKYYTASTNNFRQNFHYTAVLSERIIPLEPLTIRTTRAAANLVEKHFPNSHHKTIGALCN